MRKIIEAGRSLFIIDSDAHDNGETGIGYCKGRWVSIRELKKGRDEVISFNINMDYVSKIREALLEVERDNNEKTILIGQNAPHNHSE